MGKRQNLVVLQGELRCNGGVREVPLDGRLLPVRECRIATDHPAYGGVHTVLATGRLAVEVEAFVQAARDHGYGSLWATVNGWLRSQNGSAVVVADRIMFLVDGDVRREAAARVRSMLRRDGHVQARRPIPRRGA